MVITVNGAPKAVATANTTSGTAPLAVTFSGLGSTDADGDTLTYAWDLDGDGLLDDSTAAQPTFSYTTPGTYTATLKVTDKAEHPAPPRGDHGQRAPKAVATADVTSGTAPLAVTFSGLGSTDADGDALTYAWDLDGDNLLDDSTAAQPTFNYTTPGTYTVTLKVTDTDGRSAPRRGDRRSGTPGPGAGPRPADVAVRADREARLLRTGDDPERSDPRRERQPIRSGGAGGPTPSSRRPPPRPTAHAPLRPSR